MTDRVELRVHAGASSNQQHDRQYVAQAEAYLSLGTASLVRIVPLTVEPAHITTEPRQTENHLNEDSTTVSEILLRQNDSYLEDTQLAYTALESQLFTSSAAIALATPARGNACDLGSAAGIARPQTPQPEQQLQNELNNELTSAERRQGTARTPPSQSSYLRSPMLSRSAKRLRFSAPTRPSSTSRRRVSASVSPNAARHGVQWQVTKRGESDNHNDSAGGTVVSDETTSELPTSYSLSDIATDSLKGRPQLSDRFNSDPGPLNFHEYGSPDKQPQTRAPEPHGRAREVVEVSEAMPNFPVVDRGQTAMCGGSEVELQVHAGINPNKTSVDIGLGALETLSVEIHAPPARVAIDPCITHVTKALRRLEETFSGTYRPVSVSRQLAVHERGYWLLHCSSWSPAKQAAMWQLLEASIKSGSVGWGVWCTRATDVILPTGNDTLSSKRRIEEDQRSPTDRFGPIRLYCSGEVARHTYLLLYTASEGSVRKAGLQWIDSTGAVVIQMKG